MRELTFGDLAVPREIKRATAALFDRHGAYLAALAGRSDISVSDALKAQLGYLGGGPLNSRRLSDYVQRCTNALDAQPTAQILAGRVEWPDPRAI